MPNVNIDTRTLVHAGIVRLKRCRHGLMLCLVTDQYVGQSLNRYGEFSEGEMQLLGPLIRRGDVVVDMGANVGAHTVFFAKRVGEGGRTLAFEPQRFIFQMLCGAVALNGLANVYTYHAACGREAGRALMPPCDYSTMNNFSGLSAEGWPEGESVAVMPLDELDLPRCRLIKIDVEGMEQDAIAGAADTIRRLRPLLYVENDRADKSAALIDQLLSMDYRLYWHLPPLFNPDNYFRERENIFGAIVSANMLGVQKSSTRRFPGLRRIQSPSDDWAK